MIISKHYLLALAIGLSAALEPDAQKPVLITESTVKLGPFKEEIFFYGFAAGDKLVFDFKETNDKELKEVEITEMPASSKFLELKANKIEKTIDVANTGIYKFRFTNGTVLPRTIKFNISRIPASAATQNFNTTVYTHTVNDTLFETEKESYIDRTDTVLTNLQDRVVKLQGTNKSTFNFLLSENTIAWGYYIYTDEPGKKIFEDASKSLAENPTVTKFKNYNPVAAEAYGQESYLKKLEPGNQINFWLVEGENAELFNTGAQFKYIKKGTVVNDFSKMAYRKGALYFCFSNGPSGAPATITVKISALHINEVPRTRLIKHVVSIKPKTEMYLKN